MKTATENVRVMTDSVYFTYYSTTFNDTPRLPIHESNIEEDCKILFVEQWAVDSLVVWKVENVSFHCLKYSRALLK